MIRILKDIIFNETEMAISINIRSLFEETTTLTIFTEITKIIEKISNISDADIADINDINIIFENIENAPFENIIVEPAPVRRSIRYRKAIFKAVETNIMAANIMGIAEAPIISANKKESEEEDYLSKAIITKIIIANENKPTYEEAMANSKKFQ
jgi:hypothetical protein